MSDKTREQVRKDFESQILKSIKYANLERDALSDYISPFTLASWQSWQAAHEMYEPKWISVEDERPDNSQIGHKILGWNGYAFECECDDDGDWCNIGGEDFTHWMPLPKQEKDE